MEIKLQKYDAYKNSGVEWIGEIPQHWFPLKIKLIAKVYNGDSLNDSYKKKFESDDLDEFSYISSKDIDVNNSFIEYNNGLRIPKTFGTFKIAPKNTSLLCIEGGSAGRKIAFTNQEVYFVNKLACFNVANFSTSKFLYYSLKGDLFQTQFKLSMTGMIGGVSISNINNFFITFPPISEQTAIAKFLDDKTEKIDQAIRVKQEQIALLKERRQVLIHEAVTRGLDKDVKLKDSGVAWIGEIPEAWEVKRIKHVTNKIGSGVTPSGGGSTYLDEGIPLLRSQNIFFGKIELDGVAFISENTHQAMSNSQVLKGDVLLNITGGSIGRCFYVEFDFPMNVNQHVCILRPTSKITTLYLNSLIASEIGQNQIWFHQQGGGREGLNFQALKNFLIPFPPKEEQIKISEFIQSVSEKIATAISLKEKEIEKLKEYKATLINSVVTGKVRVS